MKPSPDQFESIKEFYNKEYYGVSAIHSSLPWHCKKIGRRLGVMTGKSVLDVACGTGEWLDFFNRQQATIAGVDLSEAAVNVCRQHFPNGDFICGPAESLPFENSRFDLITCMGSLEHFLDKPLALAEMRRVAKPEAQILILVPNAGFLTRQLGLYKGTNQTKVKEDVYDLETWGKLLDESGFNVVERWSDLHPISRSWIMRGNFLFWPIRLVQALALALWPLEWQYQVYHYCVLAEAK